MKKVITERGLMIKLSELYELVQDNIGDNFIDFVKSIIHTPGLRIANGDEFLVHQVGDSLMIKAGAVVFQNYDVFVPSHSAADLAIDISDIEGINEPGTQYAIYLALEIEETHPQRQLGTIELFMTVQQNIVKAYIYPLLSSPPENSYLLALAEVQNNKILKLEDKRFSSILKLVSKYVNENWEITETTTTVENVKVKFVTLEGYKQSSVEGYPINRQSLVINRRISPAIEVTWKAPTVAELDAVGGVIYYKVEAIPIHETVSYPQAVISQAVMIDRIGGTKLPTGRIGCLMNAELGIRYSITVYRVNNILDMQISDGSDPIEIVAGIESCIISPTPVSLEIDYTLNSTDFINISSNAMSSSDTILRLFVREYAVTPYTQEGMEDLKYMIYEGAVKDIIYRIQDKTNTGVSVYLQIKGKYSNKINSSFVESFEFVAETVSEYEDIFTFDIPESSAGWPGRDLPADQATGVNIICFPGNALTYIDGFAVADKPHNRAAGDYLYLANSTNPPNLAAGWYKVLYAEDDFLIMGTVIGTSGVGTIDIMGNVEITNSSNPVVLRHDPNSHLKNLFVVGNKLVVDNTTNAAALPNGTYTIVAVNVGAGTISIDHTTGTPGAGYCDVAADSPITLHEFSLSQDAILSRIKVSGFQGQELNDDSTVSGWIAKYTVSSSAGDKYINVPRSGGGDKTFEELIIIPAGSTITIKLERGADTIKGINASAYKMFLYFKYSL